MDAQAEDWRDVPGWEGLYQASSLGRVRSLDRRSYSCCTKGLTLYRGRILSARGCGKYLGVSLYRDGKNTRRSGYIHRLVALAFHGQPKPGQEVAHLDGNRHNNRAHNLAWVSRSENQAHKWGHGTVLLGEKHPRCTISDTDVAAMRASRAAGQSYAEIGRKFGRATATVWNICNGVYRSHT